ncbi:hypothetical protein DL237_19060 [Pseudooceanicola sediminis]|uniref:Ketopantoate reductase C-terminal domain-containing protein n=1 Tax=Pseudooceanicola sediminis TaxID=2211117 RepID=A0A399IVQ1_9RHOB|nr:hypothetical protein E0K93_16145 [Puniceibacterium sp. HSS470]RII37104.1 hypothetical protein DL237_19060 [Pseudooceanicola sediminis]
MIGGVIEAMSESAAMISTHGGDPAPFLDMLRQTILATQIYQTYGAAIASGKAPGALSALKLPLKDLDLTRKKGRTAVPLIPLADLLCDQLNTARGVGMMDVDWSVGLAMVAR